MTAKEFAEKYNIVATEDLKNKYLKDTINVKKYLGFNDKINTLERIINTTTYEYDEKNNITTNININSVTRYVLFHLSLIDSYTNIDINFNNVIEEYDALDENGLLDLFVGGENTIIPQEEIIKMQTLLNMMLNDKLQNSFSTQAFIQNQVTRFGTLIGVTLSPIMDKIADNLNDLDDSKIEKLANRIEKAFKRI